MSRALYCYRQEGRFNLMRDEREAQLVIRFTVGDEVHTLSDTVEIGGKYDTCTDDPFEMFSVLERSIERYWVSTSRDEQRKVIALFKEHERELRLAWLKERAERLQKIARDAARDARFAYDAWRDEVES